MDDPDVMGKVGRVLVRVRGADGPGEVLVRVRGGRETFIAYADAVIERDRDVLVIRSRGHRCVDVVPWEWSDPGPGAPAEVAVDDPGSGGVDSPG